MAWPEDLYPDVYQRMVTQMGGGALPGMTLPGMPGAPGQTPQTEPSFLEKIGNLLGIGGPKPPGGENTSTNLGALLPGLVLSQLGAQMQQPPAERQKMAGQLPATMLAAIKLQQNSQEEKQKMALQRMYMGAMLKPDKNTTDQLLADAIKSGDTQKIQQIQDAIQGKKAEVVKAPQTRTVQIGEEKVTQEYDPNTDTWNEVGRGPAWNPKPPAEKAPILLEDKEGNLVPWQSGQSLAGLKKPGQSGELDLTPEAVDAMADRYMIDGTMPGLGLGKAATKARSMVMNRVAEKMGETGQSPSDLKTNQIVAGGLRSEANRLLGQRGPMLAFAQTADKNLDIALNLSGQVDRTGVPVLNRWLLAGKKSLAGDPDVAAFHAANQVAINEFAKVTSSATGGGVTSDQARKEIEDVLNTAQTPEQYQRVVQTLRMDMNNRVQGYEESLNRLKNASKQLGASWGKDGGGSQTAGPDPQALQTAFQNAVDKVNAMPDGPQKQQAIQKLNDWKTRNLGQ